MGCGGGGFVSSGIEGDEVKSELFFEVKRLPAYDFDSVPFLAESSGREFVFSVSDSLRSVPAGLGLGHSHQHGLG